MSEHIDKTQLEIFLSDCDSLKAKERELDNLKNETDNLKKSLLGRMTSWGVKSIDLPGDMKVTKVEYIKESIPDKEVPRVKELLPENERLVIIKTKEYIDAKGIELLKGRLTEAQMLEVLSLTPVVYLKFTDREGKQK